MPIIRLFAFLTLASAALVAGSAVSAIAAVCGDGFSDPGEQCDDGNLFNGDGCSQNCQREILNPVPSAGDHFGEAIAVVGVTNVLVGAPTFDVTNAINTGVAHLFSASAGTLLRTFANPSPDPGDEFGAAVASVGANVLVAAPLDDTAGPNAGAAYLFNAATGALIRTFLNPDPGVNDHFGTAVAILGSNILVGAPEDTTGAGGGGVAYLINASTGAVVQVFLNPLPAASDAFGSAIAVVGGDVVVGARNHDTPMANVGEAYLFDPTTGAVIRTFANPTPATGDLFGFSLAAFGSNLLIGAPGIDQVSNGGTAYLYDPSTGALLRTFSSPSPAINDAFGYAVVALGSDRVVISARLDDVGVLNSGAVYVFHASTGALLDTFKKPIPATEDHFGESVAVLGERVLGGAPLDDVGETDTGAVYVFTDRSCGNGTTEGGETCDDGNAVDGDGCDSNCAVTACGNGVVTAGEDCDDGNLVAADGCSATCAFEGVCGDGSVGPGEICDDANLVSGDGCDANCTPTGCGNGFVTGGEQCDEGAANGLTLCCSATCTAIDTDADAICDQVDVCPSMADPLQINADGDIFGDACDLCPNDVDNDSDGDGFCFGSTFQPPAIGGGDPCSRGAAGVWTKPRLKLGSLTKGAGNHTLKLSGLFVNGSSLPVLAPQNHGVQVRIVDQSGAVIVDEHIPGGLLFPGGTTGWKTSGSPAKKWVFADRNEPLLYNGIAKIVVKDLGQVSPNRVSVQVAGKHGNYPVTSPSQAPLRMTVELNDTALPPGGTPGRNQCGEQAFGFPPSQPACTFKPTSLECK